jgi:hypothetical protein
MEGAREQNEYRKKPKINVTLSAKWTYNEEVRSK